MRINPPNQYDELVLSYQTAFQAKYGRSPLELAENARSKGWSIIKRMRHDMETIRAVISHFFSMDGADEKDTWFRKKGHSLECLEINLDAVYADFLLKNNTGHNTKTYWVNGASESGYFMIESTPRVVHPNFKPIRFNEWKRLSVQGKCQNLMDDPRYGFLLSRVPEALKDQFQNGELD